MYYFIWNQRVLINIEIFTKKYRLDWKTLRTSMKLVGSNREGNNEYSLNPGWKILGSPHDDGTSSWLSNPVATKASDYVHATYVFLGTWKKQI